MTDDLTNLANHVKARRAQMDWTQLDVYARGGPSNSKLTEIEDARPPSPSRATLRKLDVGLGWAPGSAKACLAGGEPSVGSDPQDEPQYVESPGERATEGMTDDEVLRKLEQMQEDIRTMSEWVAKRAREGRP